MAKKKVVGSEVFSFTRDNLVAAYKLLGIRERRGLSIRNDEFYSMDMDELANLQADDMLSTLTSVADVES